MRDSLGLSQVELGDKLNMSQASIASIESGRRSLRDVHIFQICALFGVSEEWLRTGSGSMFEESEAISLDRYAQRKGLAGLEIEMIKAYLDIPSDIRRTVVEKIKTAVMSSVSTKDPVEEELEDGRVEPETKKKKG